MKNRFLKVLALALLLALVIGALPAMAAAKKAKIVSEEYYAGSGVNYLNLKNWTWEEEILSVTSSNPKVLKVEDEGYTQVVPLKPGKAVVTMKYRLNGKQYTVKGTITVVKYPNAIKKLTFNGKKVNLKNWNNKTFYEVLDFDLKKMQVNLTPAKGWEIAKIKGKYINADTEKTVKTFTGKNNKKYTVSRDYHAWLTYTLKNKKSGETFVYPVMLQRIGE